MFIQMNKCVVLRGIFILILCSIIIIFCSFMFNLFSVDQVVVEMDDDVDFPNLSTPHSRLQQKMDQLFVLVVVHMHLCHTNMMDVSAAAVANYCVLIAAIHFFALTVAEHLIAWIVAERSIVRTAAEHSIAWIVVEHLIAWTVAEHLNTWIVAEYLIAWTVAIHSIAWTVAEHSIAWIVAEYSIV